MLTAGFSGGQRDDIEHTAMRSTGTPQVQTSVSVLLANSSASCNSVTAHANAYAVLCIDLMRMPCSGLL